MNEMELIRSLTPGAWGTWTLVVIAIITLIKGWPVLRKIGLEGDTSLRQDLLARIVKLEGDLRAERQQCDERIKVLECQIRGLEQQLLQLHLSTGKPIILHSPKEG